MYYLSYTYVHFVMCNILQHKTCDYHLCVCIPTYVVVVTMCNNACMEVCIATTLDLQLWSYIGMYLIYGDYINFALCGILSISIIKYVST